MSHNMRTSAVMYGRKRKPSAMKYTFWTIIWLVLAAILTLGWFGWNLNITKGNSVTDFTVEEGAGVNAISTDLFEAGAIESKLVFETYLYLKDLEGAIIAGNYQIPRSSIKALTGQLTTGPGREEKKVTFIEGWTLVDIADYIEEQGISSKEDFLDIVNKPVANGFSAEKYPILYAKPDTVDLEGYLFPDTYRVYKTVTAEQVVDVMIQTLTKRITREMAEEIDSQGKTFHEIMTMASIIEKEVISDKDRRIVSGILWKRIDAGMALQVDSTVNYITGNSRPGVLIDETKIDNRFNTYKYRGLPPGPIANPSLSSIQAAIYPTDSEYWFYLSKPDGETVFSENFEAHVNAKNKYLK